MLLETRIGVSLKKRTSSARTHESMRIEIAKIQRLMRVDKMWGRRLRLIPGIIYEWTFTSIGGIINEEIMGWQGVRGSHFERENARWIKDWKAS